MNTNNFQMNSQPDAHVALLIDGENGSASIAEAIMSRAEEWGTATLRRVYGDWSTVQMRPWREVVTRYGMRAVHQHLPKKNAADIALTADAIDLFHQGFRRFCLVSGDSDYVPLILWLREHHCLVMVIGQRDAPLVLQHACSLFVTSEQLCSPPHIQNASSYTEPATPALPSTRPQSRNRKRKRPRRPSPPPDRNIDRKQ